MAGPIIIIEGLRKTHRLGRVRALDGVSLEIRAGEALGLIGPNGAGKSTLLGCVVGLLRSDAGRVTIDGAPPDDLDVRARLGWLPERPSFHAGMNARQQLELHHALLGRGAAGRGACVDAALDSVRLEAAARKRRPGRFSQGMKQRLGLAMALLGMPDLLVLDEPTTGLDPGGVLMVRALVAESRARGATVLLSSHQLDEVARSCDRVALLRGGRIEAEESPGDTARLERFFDGTSP
jgi:ABC-2 type transport system ATP-binding protein